MKPASPPAIDTASTTSHPHPVTRAATCEGEEGGEGAGMITTFFHAASTTTSSHPPRNGHTNDFVGGCFILCWRLCPEQGGGAGAGRLQASAPSRLCTKGGRWGGARERGGEEGVLGRAGRLQASDPNHGAAAVGTLRGT